MSLEAAGVGHRITHDDDLPEAREVAVLALDLAGAHLVRDNRDEPLLAALIGITLSSIRDEVAPEPADPNECPSPCGTVVAGSPDTFLGVDKRQAALADQLELECDKHSNKPILKGSLDVWVNKKPWARRTDETKCGAFIGEGEPTVLLGADTQKSGAREGGDVPSWLRQGVRGVLQSSGLNLGAGDYSAAIGGVDRWLDSAKRRWRSDRDDSGAAAGADIARGDR
jgi:uncharacterized Zn-binding protein involved in type VI secretion